MAKNKTSTPDHLHPMHKPEVDESGDHYRYHPKDSFVSTAKHQHPLHSQNKEVTGKPVIVKDGPHITMPDHQHPLHAPTTTVKHHKQRQK